MRIYLDHNATTPVDSGVVDMVSNVLRTCYGNASSVHTFGQSAKALLDDARSNVAALLAEKFGSLEALRARSVEELAEVDEIGEIIARSVYDFLHSSHGENILADLSAVGVQLEAKQTKSAEGATLAGKTFVVTGSLSKYTRDEIHELIAQHGGRASTSVSQKTDFLIAGEKAGGKLEKAENLGVKILSEADFSRLIAE